MSFLREKIHRSSHPFTKDFIEKRSFVGMGDESVVYRYTRDQKEHIVKEAKNRISLYLRLAGLPSHILRSPKLVRLRVNDYRKLKELLGERLVTTDYIIGHSTRDGKPTVYIHQPFIHGMTLLEFKKQAIEVDFSASPRQHMLQIVWAAKKACVEFGIPFDLNPQNILQEEDTKALFLIDTFPPTFIAQLIGIQPVGKTKKDASQEHSFIVAAKSQFLSCLLVRFAVITMLEEIEHWERRMQPSASEKARLDGAFSIHDARYQAQIQNIYERFASFPKWMQFTVNSLFSLFYG